MPWPEGAEDECFIEMKEFYHRVPQDPTDLIFRDRFVFEPKHNLT